MLLVSMSVNPLLSGSSYFFWGNSGLQGSAITAWGLTADQSSGGEKNCI